MHDVMLNGLAFCGESYTPRNVLITIEDGIIKSIEDIKSEITHWITPAFFNAHTHIGDAVAMDTPIANKSLKELVAPPNGLKHQILRSTPDNVLVDGMQDTMRFMYDTGTIAFADFREGGVHGFNLISNAKIPEVYPLIFGRDGGESLSIGYGVSSANNQCLNLNEIESARKNGKLIAVHAGESDTLDIESAFALDPDIIIHATHFTDKNIREAADRNIPIVLCPRSNWILGCTNNSSKPPVKKMIDAGCTLWLGTDNAMFVSPNMLSECAFMSNIYKINPERIMSMATNGFSLLTRNSNCGIIEEGQPANLLYINPGYVGKWTKNPLLSFITRMDAKSIQKVYGYYKK
ncbi:MAG TPA: amidohydrolase family protein [Methanocorpusculum sp.]|nr:amidohydrolase family protein [Methanocorpusculum sp.]